jgi:hypothetical protein
LRTPAEILSHSQLDTLWGELTEMGGGLIPGSARLPLPRYAPLLPPDLRSSGCLLPSQPSRGTRAAGGGFAAIEPHFNASFQWSGSLAVNLTGEAGTIAGAAWGREALPARWLAMLHQREYIERTAAHLSEQRDGKQGTGTVR